MSFDTFSRGHEKARLGESPCWDPERNEIWWVDVAGSRLFRTAVASYDTQSWHTPELPGFVALRASNAPVVGMQTGIFSFDPVAGTFQRLLPHDARDSRFNDATVDAGGRLWASTMALQAEAGRAAIHLVRPDLQLDTVVDGLAIPNGMAVDLKRGRLLYSDSHPRSQRIWSMTLSEDGRPNGGAVPFASTESLPGRPDGAALSVDGSYWIAGVDGGELYVFDRDGRLDATVPVPFPEPTKICFFGEDGRRIAVTSKLAGEYGGRLAFSRVPPDRPAGMVQPYWAHGAQ